MKIFSIYRGSTFLDFADKFITEFGEFFSLLFLQKKKGKI